MMLDELESYLDAKTITEGLVFDAMRYSLLSGGKRVRPLLLLNLVDDLKSDYRGALPLAAALEMVHTYSLVHDDLPSMDNDDYRRHRLTNHKVYGEATAILAGDGLLSESFTLLAESNLDPSVIVGSLEVLARNAGAKGMILGQELDIKDEHESLDDLIQCYTLKTGCLFAAAFEMAVLYCNRKDLQEKARELGYKLGVVFQYQDDILEETQSFEAIGKSNESDKDRSKNTVIGFLGLEEAQKQTQLVFDEIKALIQAIAGNNSKCESMIHEMVSRAF